MTDDIRTVLWPLPGSVRGFTCIVEDFITIVINEALSPQARRRAWRHEVEHIENGDFEALRLGLSTANRIEEDAHVGRKT